MLIVYLEFLILACTIYILAPFSAISFDAYLGFMFQFIARHLLHTLNVIVVESLTIFHYYCPMCVQPSSVLTVTINTSTKEAVVGAFIKPSLR